MFTVNKGSGSKLDLPGLTIGAVTFGAQSTRFDLECQFIDTPHELKGAITYNTDLFDAITIQRLVENFEVLLTSIAENPDRPLSTLPLLTPDEDRCLLSEWNRIATLIGLKNRHTPCLKSRLCAPRECGRIVWRYDA